MKKIVDTLLIAFWLYFGTYLTATPTLAEVTASQTTNKVETVDSINSVAQLATKDLAPKTVQQFLSVLPSNYY